MVDSSAWLYASLDDVEIISLTSEEATRIFVENIAMQRANLDAILPKEFRITWDRPMSVVLYGVDNPKPLPDVFAPILSRKHTEKARAEALEKREAKPLDVYVVPRILPGAWAPDADSITVFNLVVPRLKSSELSPLPASSFVSYLMHARTPPNAPWLMIGFSNLYARASMSGSDMDLPPFVWISGAQTQLLLKNKRMEAEFVPMSEIFTNAAASGATMDEHRRQVLVAQTGLFVRWVFEGKVPGGLDALWRFAGGTTTGPESAAWFKTCFGLTQEAALEALKAYLPGAMRRPVRVRLQRENRVPSFDLRPATANEVARIKGDWERLAGRMVAKENPELREYYLEGARRTVARGPADSDADPELLAARGLLFVETGDDASALPLLEAACAGARPRPLAVVELARIRLANARAAMATGEKLDDATVASIVEIVRPVLGARPPMPRALQVLAETWSVAATPPTAADLDALVAGLRMAPGDASSVVAAARLLIDSGRVDDARNAIEAGLLHVTDEGGRRRLYAIRSAVRAATPR